jgi:hypothetical protein
VLRPNCVNMAQRPPTRLTIQRFAKGRTQHCHGHQTGTGARDVPARSAFDQAGAVREYLRLLRLRCCCGPRRPALRREYQDAP